jgi:hypothetical protein
MQALLGLGLIAGTLAAAYALTPVEGGMSARPSWVDACVAIIGSSAIMLGVAGIISHLAG